jgi:hypothetical protein
MTYNETNQLHITQKVLEKFGLHRLMNINAP